MQKCIAIGELLVDFVPTQNGEKLKDVRQFAKMTGGAPANVAATIAKLGGNSLMISKVGNDPFGDFLIETLDSVGVNTTHILKTDDAKTALAFVSLTKAGDRDFSFYRNPSADMLLKPSEIHPDWFESHDIFHFGSVDLIDAPVREAHLQALRYANERQCVISFDPNLRFSLWPDKKRYFQTLQEFLPAAHLVKLSDDEWEFVTGKTRLEDALDFLFGMNVKILLLTKGKNGATIYSKKSCISHEGFRVPVADTTGAGDSFMGAILYQILKKGLTLPSLERLMDPEVLRFANKVSSLVVQKSGAIAALPTLNEVLRDLC